MLSEIDSSAAFSVIQVRIQVSQFVGCRLSSTYPLRRPNIEMGLSTANKLGT